MESLPRSSDKVETIHDKVDDKLRADWSKLDAGLKNRKADMLKAYKEKMMVERKVDQGNMEAERKARQEDLQKIVTEMMDASQTKRDESHEGMDVNVKEIREEIKSGQAEMKFTVNAFQEKKDTPIVNRKDDQKETSCQETMAAGLEYEEPASGDMKEPEERRQPSKMQWRLIERRLSPI
jgi:enoyl reductase-like protein